jgi:hypothetical protein
MTRRLRMLYHRFTYWLSRLDVDALGWLAFGCLVALLAYGRLLVVIGVMKGW